MSIDEEIKCKIEDYIHEHIKCNFIEFLGESIEYTINGIKDEIEMIKYRRDMDSDVYLIEYDNKRFIQDTIENIDSVLEITEKLKELKNELSNV